MRPDVLTPDEVATWLRVARGTVLELGVAEDVRMARLGHATKAMARHYAGASEALDRDAVAKLAGAIG